MPATVRPEYPGRHSFEAAVFPRNSTSSKRPAVDPVLTHRRLRLETPAAPADRLRLDTMYQPTPVPVAGMFDIAIAVQRAPPLVEYCRSKVMSGEETSLRYPKLSHSSE